jgi:predicted transcriptional regulator
LVLKSLKTGFDAQAYIQLLEKCSRAEINDLIINNLVARFYSVKLQPPKNGGDYIIESMVDLFSWPVENKNTMEVYSKLLLQSRKRKQIDG